MAIYNGREVEIGTLESWESPMVRIAYVGGQPESTVVKLSELELTTEEKERFDEQNRSYRLITDKTSLPEYLTFKKDGKVMHKNESARQQKAKEATETSPIQTPLQKQAIQDKQQSKANRPL